MQPMDNTAANQRIRSALAQGKGTVVLGPIFSRGLDALDIDQHLDELQSDLNDPSGWENLDRECRLKLASVDLGSDTIRAGLAEFYPSISSLEPLLKPFHSKLLSLNVTSIVDLSFHELSAAVLKSQDRRYRYITQDADLVDQSHSLPGEIDIFKLRGDLWLSEAALTIDQLRRRLADNPGLQRLLSDRLRREPVILYGFTPNDPLLRFMVEHFTLSGTTVLCLRITNRTWRQYWMSEGLQVVDASTSTELENRVSDWCDVLQETADISDLDDLIAEVGDTVVLRLAGSEQLEWAKRPRAELDHLNSVELQSVKQSVRFLSALTERNLLIPALPAALAAEICMNSGDLPLARQALEVATKAIDGHVNKDADAMAAVGRTLIRMGDSHRSMDYLTAALHTKGRSDESCADDFAWLSRCVLQRIDQLRKNGRKRAVIELVAHFLSAQSNFLHLVNNHTDNESFGRSIYYINLRLGRLMALASEMAEQSASVYASQAVEMLKRAIELKPEKPDGYKAIRPLLTDRRYTTVDPKLWMTLVGSAPPAVQRRLGGR